MPSFDIRRAHERYATRVDGMETLHSFSYGDHYDPDNVGFGFLRAINEEIIAPGAGYHPHRHEDVEIVTWVLDGLLAHQDTAGESGVVPVGVAQRLSAGTGVSHGEHNASDTEPLRFIQMMLTPDAWQLEPAYAQAAVPVEAGWVEAIDVHQAGAKLLIARPSADTTLTLPASDLVHLHVTRGSIVIGDVDLYAGDCARITGRSAYDLKASMSAELLVWLMTSPTNR